jgi:hypothetical protein
MKKLFYTALLTTIFAFAPSCSDKKKETKEQKAEVYECPMKCSDYKSDKPGTCPVCGMDLEKVNPS